VLILGNLVVSLPFFADMVTGAGLGESVSIASGFEDGSLFIVVPLTACKLGETTGDGGELREGCEWGGEADGLAR
jgi:hypothetical protein